MQLATLLFAAAVLTVGSSALKISLRERRMVEKRESGVSDADIKIILDTHNGFRSAVSPTAANMQKMVWDDKIAEVAQQWADTCIAGHDTNDDRKNGVGYGISIGQNWAGGYGSWANAIKGWHSEVADFTYGTGGVFNDVGHYTQVVGHQASGIGCGYNSCSSPNYVCNYAYGQYNWKAPYRSGESCADCKTCSDKLCDCGGKICKNGGDLDLQTCTCTCPSLFGGDDCGEELCVGTVCQNKGTINPDDCTCNCVKPYGGDDCSTANCPDKDAWYCVSQWPPSFCTIYNNVPEDCPFMCDICSKKRLAAPPSNRAMRLEAPPPSDE